PSPEDLAAKTLEARVVERRPPRFGRLGPGDLPPGIVRGKLPLPFLELGSRGRGEIERGAPQVAIPRIHRPEVLRLDGRLDPKEPEQPILAEPGEEALQERMTPRRERRVDDRG